MKAIVPAEQWSGTEGKLNSFQQSYGTILFFEDVATIEEFQNKFATYQDRFPEWAAHSSGMIQYIVWTALAAEGVGASLQVIPFPKSLHQGSQKKSQMGKRKAYPAPLLPLLSYSTIILWLIPELGILGIYLSNGD